MADASRSNAFACALSASVILSVPDGSSGAFRKSLRGVPSILSGSLPLTIFAKPDSTALLIQNSHVGRCTSSNSSKAGATVINLITGELLGYAKSRKTVHFALSGLVVEHDGGSWEDKTYAVILPLQDYVSRLFNLFPYDSYAIGDVALNERCVVIVPQKSDYRSHLGEKVVYFDPARSKIRSVIEKVIQMQGGWKIKLHHGMGAADSIATLAHYPTENVSALPFWDAFLEKHPHLSFGPMEYSLKGAACHLKLFTTYLEKFEMAISFKECAPYRLLFSNIHEELPLLEGRLAAIKGHISDELHATLKAEMETILYIISLEARSKAILNKSLFGLGIEDFIQKKLTVGEEKEDWEFVQQAARKCESASDIDPCYFLRPLDEINKGTLFTQLAPKKDASIFWLWGQAYLEARYDPSVAHLERLEKLTRAFVRAGIWNYNMQSMMSKSIEDWSEAIDKVDCLLPNKENQKLIDYLKKLLSVLDRFYDS